MGLSAASAFAQGYYPPANSPIDGNASLLYLEDRLDGVVGNGNTSTKSLIVPPPAGKTLATDAELQAALQSGVADAVDGTAISGGVTVYSLVNEVSKYRPAKTGNWMTAATTAIIGQANVANITTDLEAATRGAVIPNPKGAPGVVKNAIKLIATLSSTTDVNGDDIVEQAVANAAAFADKIVTSAFSSAKKIDTGDVANVEQDIVSEAVQEATAAGASYLIEEILTAAEKGRATGVSSGAIAAAAINFRLGGSTGLPVTKEDAAAVAGGAMRGAGVGEISNIVAGVNGATASAFMTYLTKVGEGYSAVAPSTDPAISGPALIATFTAAGNKDYIPALLTGGLSSLNRIDADVIKSALMADDTQNGAATVQEIVRAAVRVVQKDAANIAVAALGAANANITLSKINEGAAQGTAVDFIGAIVLKTIKALPLVAANAKGAVDGAIRGATATGKSGAIADIALQGTKASKLGNDVADQGIETLHLLTQDSLQYVAVLGALAGDKKNAAAIQAHALLNVNLAAAQVDPINTGGSVLKLVQLAPKNFFNLTLDGLTSAANNTPIETEAIVLGAGLANPKGSGAIAAAAIVKTNVSTAAIIAAAKDTDRKHSFNIDLAANAAIFFKATPDVSAQFDYVNHTVFQNQKFAADIATGATVAAPQNAHRIGHAAAFAAPAGAAKVVTVLFAYAQLDNHLSALNPEILNPVAAATAITAGFTNGILEAKLIQAKELAALKGAVSAAVKAAMLLQGNGVEGAGNFRQSNGGAGTFFPAPTTQKGAAGVITGYVSQELAASDVALPGGSTGTVAAIITAAAMTAKIYALEIAQAAAQAARFVSPVFTDEASIIAAIIAAGSAFTSTQITNAVNFGFNEAVAGRVGAGAAGVVNYTHHTGTGAPVTSIFDL